MKRLQQLYDFGIVAIVRGARAKDVLPIAKALQKGGIQAIEITLNSPNALAVIEQVKAELGDDMLVGAGTVLDSESARAAIAAGATFIISPTLDVGTIEITKRYGAISIPGAFTPTEILTGFQRGADIMKVFPATSLGPSYIKDIHGPLPQIPLMPTGGIGLGNIASYIQAGAVAVGVGSSLVNAKETVNESYLRQLTEKAQQMAAEVRRARNAEGRKE
ncbi:bifunctional 4-hydroxy-2-oxoglutarate aldolase/2-dehydro-3-deoxy-phosphogluconate aldolase [Fodinisporobacter ferrooxydans]|uniref:Bifunctional 4-hydroxy-2-oxoglutarate aldolase/2-dehydro-3-deoxy-phosphogluconate aldolase n=1 Tax=Fodinisporobacter ferrooxydans TaxID=2901836 RepID=A0ABY4CQN1_9BACL|nr:bifunctional 4-hydroxy-2-oxoglutarate aldolase/2-dehydro-3-deoxy-phosphogluconate aldolase [Alicyclobacillaceae bacterium MYW30-H2]